MAPARRAASRRAPAVGVVQCPELRNRPPEHGRKCGTICWNYRTIHRTVCWNCRTVHGTIRRMLKNVLKEKECFFGICFLHYLKRRCGRIVQLNKVLFLHMLIPQCITRPLGVDLDHHSHTHIIAASHKKHDSTGYIPPIHHLNQHHPIQS